MNLQMYWATFEKWLGSAGKQYQHKNNSWSPVEEAAPGSGALSCEQEDSGFCL